jgi:hypothetical protein
MFLNVRRIRGKMMQRKPTKTTRGPNAEEKRFMAWVKEQHCIVYGTPGPSIAHHCEGATFKHKKVLVGHWFLLPLSQDADDIVTHGSRKRFREAFGPQSSLWLKLIKKSPIQPPADVIDAITDWGR